MKSALTDSDKRQKVIKKRNAVARAWYPDSVKLEALKLWLISGNLRTVGASLGIPYPTLQVWRYSDWWGQLAEEIRTEGQMSLSNKLKTIAERAMDETLDRLEKGDWVLNQKTGKMERKPVAMRDAHRVAESFTDRHIRLDTKPQEAINNQKIQDRLQNLAIAFEQFAKKAKKIEVVDIEGNDLAENTNSSDQTIEGTWRERTEESSIRSAEQDGAYEGEDTDSEGESTEFHDSGTESEGQSSQV
jgi:hypothetical protein